MIPLFHDFRGERVLVFGGGRVGYRKARRFAREAEVVVVAAAFADEFEPLFEDEGDERPPLSPVKARIDPSDVGTWLDRAAPALVVAATDDAALNEAVERAASERGVLVNRTDEHGGRDAGSVVVPATARDGNVVVAVGTGGRSPALSRELRKRIEPELAGAETVAVVTAELREDLKRRGLPAETRRDAVRAVVESDAVWRAETEEGSKKKATEIAERVLGD
ncbi:siroheme synthase [Haladaptatus paucihalophilus DX253]|uniref:precorrin-2 dehydrogenase n=1 Tax=Haladaptatus paucihalophilus DX253 TaxID=797209 RepID=E7QXD9_HALPU|nr:bifunctional precorrin-2 dehydrogenase/sirohydrochlorin ferrochelatase [Haladaptatus paucihalophilus]EFW90942.1 siroheme synthase [Haladaptatus paucihalophilus DX253]SHK26882.1 precorrin-2 dehydrogenase / sirohydrochlorin ferrochelatase [Haladaptatus paucihalophilus DX253]